VRDSDKRIIRFDLQPGAGLEAQALQSFRLHEDPSMKLVLTLLGVVLLVVAAVYFLVPADQLPSFFPGHETGLARIRTKHGIASGVAGLVLLAAGAWMGRR
jgi:hypothetical protein